MNFAFSALGVLVVFVTKLFVNNKSDDPTDKWKRIFEIPADLALLAFLLGIAGMASLDTYTKTNQIALLVIFVASVVSVALYKANAADVTSTGGVVQFSSTKKAIGIFLLNLLISVLALAVSLFYLGANSQ